MANKGRETIYTDEIGKRITADCAAGLTRACAAARAGIGERTLATWVSKGRAGDETYSAFSASIKKAERDAEARCVAIILKAATKTWQAAAWYLERKFPESWSKDADMIREIIAELRARKTDG